MTPNCLLLDNLSETILVQILIYKIGWYNEIIREDVKRDQEETQDCQRSILHILDPEALRTTLQTLQKFKVLDFWDISVILTTPHRHSSSPRYSFFFFLPGKQTLFACYLLFHKCGSYKKHFCCLLTQGFLYSLSCSTIWLLILPDRQKKIRLNFVTPSHRTSCIFQTQLGHGRTSQSKHSEANGWVIPHPEPDREKSPQRCHTQKKLCPPKKIYRFRVSDCFSSPLFICCANCWFISWI